MKRLRAAVASDGAYHEIGFSYDSVDGSVDEKTQQNIMKEVEPAEEPYVAPEGLTIQKGMQTPSNMKIHAIIEKTAVFISQQGGQMEIIIKMKQSDNPQFAFMGFDNPLHPYYKFLVQELKAGRYKPLPDKKSKESDDEHHEEHYLHPSLVSRKAEDIPKFTVPSINFRRTGDDSYSLLVKNLKQRIEEDIQRNSPTTEFDTSSPSQIGLNSQNSTSDSDDSSSEDEAPRSRKEHAVPPPPEIQPIIDKMAEYVAKNGEDFETIVRSKHDKRFEFLNEGHKYNHYYVSRRNAVAQSLPKPLILPQVIEEQLPTSHSPVPVSVELTTCDRKTVLPSPDHSRISSSVSDSETVQIKSCSSTNLSPETQSPLSVNNYEPDTTDTMKSSGSETPPREAKVKTKVVKGPISFSLKAKELELQTEKGNRTPLLSDDDSEEEEEPSRNKSAVESDRRHRSSKDQDSSSRSRKSSSYLGDEEKSRRHNTEEIEAKLAEDKIKDKIMAAAREKIAQQKRDKLLQLERKQKAALFLQMLQKKKADAAAAEKLASSSVAANDKAKKAALAQNNKNGNSSVSPSVSDITSPGKKEAITSFPPSPLSSYPQRGQWSPTSELSENENPDEIGEKLNLTLTQSVTKEEPKAIEKPQVAKGHKSKSKSHKSSKSKKRKRSRSRSNSRKPQKAKTSTRKEKKLPSAYAVIDRKSRSKSRSPKRYTLHPRSRSPAHWSRYRS